MARPPWLLQLRVQLSRTRGLVPTWLVVRRRSVQVGARCALRLAVAQVGL